MGRRHEVRQHRSALRGVEAMTLVSDHRFPRHAHDHFGVGLMAFGAQRSWSGVGPVEAGPGDLIMVNPGEMHDGAPLGDVPRGWRIVYLDPALVRAEAEAEGLGPAELVRPVATDPLLAARFGGAFARLFEPRPDPLAGEEAFVLALVTALARHGTRAPPARPRSPPVVRALERLDAAPERPVTLAELAALSGVSRFQLLRGFSREVGATPHAYLTQARVRRARALLAGGATPADAAAASGFADQSHLTRAFRRQLGVTPGRYRAALLA